MHSSFICQKFLYSLYPVPFWTKILLLNSLHQKMLIFFSIKLLQVTNLIHQMPFVTTIFIFLCIVVFSIKLVTTNKLLLLQDPKMELYLQDPRKICIDLHDGNHTNECFSQIILPLHQAISRLEHTSWKDTMNRLNQDLIQQGRLYNQLMCQYVCIQYTVLQRLLL